MACHPVRWLARQLQRIIPHKDHRKSEIILGLAIVCAACIADGFIRHLWFQVAISEPAKAVGSAPICRLILDIVGWEG